jgi:glycosyltransferase involved in cell wall biosynthesis
MKIGIIIPTYNEENYIGELLKSLKNAIESYEFPNEIFVFVCDNGSKDDTINIIENFKTNIPYLVLLHESKKGSGYAMAKAADAAFAIVDWVISIDADCVLPFDYFSKWAEEFKKTNYPILTGYSLFPSNFEIDFPNTAKLFQQASAFNNLVTQAFGIINICGTNHSINKTFYYKIGGYTQPSIIENGMVKIVAGNDWDLGTKARISKQEIGLVNVYNEASDRRLTVDAKSFVEGTAYEGVLNHFKERIVGNDISKEEMPDLFFKNKLRTVKHFALKPLLADNSLFTTKEVKIILGKKLTNEMQEWVQTNPINDIYKDRNGFIFGSLENFHKTFGLKVFTKLDSALKNKL